MGILWAHTGAIGCIVSIFYKVYKVKLSLMVGKGLSIADGHNSTRSAMTPAMDWERSRPIIERDPILNPLINTCTLQKLPGLSISLWEFIWRI